MAAGLPRQRGTRRSPLTRFRSAWRFLAHLAREAEACRITGLAAEVTFFAVLSLFPGLLILAGALGRLETLLGYDLAARSEQAVIDFLATILTERASSVTDAVRALFEGQIGGLLTAGALFSAWTLSSGFAALIGALDIIYGLEEKRSWLNIRFTALTLAAGSVLVVMALLSWVVVGPLLMSAPGSNGLPRTQGAIAFLWSSLRLPAAFVLLAVWATTIFHLAPNWRGRTSWRAELPGGLLAAALALAVTYGFRVYLRLTAELNQILSVVGGGLLLLFWMYALSLVALLGGLLNRSLQVPGPSGGNSGRRAA